MSLAHGTVRPFDQWIMSKSFKDTHKGVRIASEDTEGDFCGLSEDA